MKVLVIGGGGREHAIVDALGRAPSVTGVWALPGNPGMAGQATLLSGPSSPQRVLEAARQLQADLVIVGPEGPLAEGVVDTLGSAGIPAFGPTRAAARLEGDKGWSKAFMARHGIPTARYLRATRLDEAASALASFGLPVVVKDAALRAGKGVTVATTRAEALAALGSIFSEARASCVIEEFMHGQEVSVLAFCDGTRAAPMLPSQDHKTIFAGDVGPMTGGMGVICPFPLGDGVLAQVQREILDPAVAGMAREGHPFVGVLYAGLMLTPDGPKVVEFNARFGDPEAEAVLPLLTGDLAQIALACAQGELDPASVTFADGASAVVILAAAGYPAEPQRGVLIPAAPVGADQRLYHAGTAVLGGQLVTAGGRVLACVGLAPDLNTALGRAYALADAAAFEGAQLRRDIGGRIGARPSEVVPGV